MPRRKQENLDAPVEDPDGYEYTQHRHAMGEVPTNRNEIRRKALDRYRDAVAPVIEWAREVMASKPDLRERDTIVAMNILIIGSAHRIEQAQKALNEVTRILGHMVERVDLSAHVEPVSLRLERVSVEISRYLEQRRAEQLASGAIESVRMVDAKVVDAKPISEAG